MISANSLEVIVTGRDVSLHMLSDLAAVFLHVAIFQSDISGSVETVEVLRFLIDPDPLVSMNQIAVFCDTWYNKSVWAAEDKKSPNARCDNK